MKWWMLAIGGLVVALALGARSQSGGDGPAVLPGLRIADMIEIQRRIGSGARMEDVFTPAQLQILQRYGRQPGGAERYGHDLLLGLSDLSDGQRRALTAMVADAEANPTVKKRFWLLAYLLLTPQQAETLTPELPFALRHMPNPSNYFTLPDMTAAEASRIKARFTEFEAVNQPGLTMISAYVPFFAGLFGRPGLQVPHRLELTHAAARACSKACSRTLWVSAAAFRKASAPGPYRTPIFWT
ncbi:MAG: hypothetical protein ACYCW6_08180 [Candidatus Xenobia bacterium]